MAIDKKVLENDLILTSGEYFKNNPSIIAGAIEDAVNSYNSFRAEESASYITTIPATLEYDLPADFRNIITIYEDTGLYNHVITNINYELTGLAASTIVPNSSQYFNSNFLDILMDRIEYYRLQSTNPKVINWTIDEVSNPKKVKFAKVPSANEKPKKYIIHYYKSFTLQTIPTYHKDYIYKLASATLMVQQAMAMSKIVQSSGPGISSTWVSPQVIMKMASDLNKEVEQAMAMYVPERA